MNRERSDVDLKLSDLKTGMTVQMRNGQEYLVLTDLYVMGITKSVNSNGKRGCFWPKGLDGAVVGDLGAIPTIGFNNYDENLTPICGVLKYWDIFKVYCPLGIDNFFDNRELVWERGEEKPIATKFQREYLNQWVKSDISSLVFNVHETAVKNGWWRSERNFPETLALCHSELSEALEVYRKTGLDDMDRIGTELADCILRIFDYCGGMGIDIERLMHEKHRYNTGRDYRHGGKKC